MIALHKNLELVPLTLERVRVLDGVTAGVVRGEFYGPFAAVYARAMLALPDLLDTAETGTPMELVAAVKRFRAAALGKPPAVDQDPEPGGFELTAEDEEVLRIWRR